MIESVAGFMSAAPTPCTARRADEEARARREAAGERREREDDEPEDEDAATAVEVGELAAGGRRT